MSHLIRLLRHTGFILGLSFVVGLVFPQGASWTEPTVTPALGFIMTLSILGISSRIFLEFRQLVRPTILALVLNYIVLSFTLIGLSSLLIRDNEVWTGFVLLAAVPPAVAVIPFTYHLGGNTRFSLVGTVAAYLMAFVITPSICLLFLGSNFIEPMNLLVLLAELIVAPLIVSRILRWIGIVSHLERYRSMLINWGFFLVIYTIVGLNRDAFMSEPETLLPVCIVAFASTFALAWLINLVFKSLGVDMSDRISLVLLGTRKMYGLAAVIAITFFSERAAMPAAVTTAFAIIHFLWLSLWSKKKEQ